MPAAGRQKPVGESKSSPLPPKSALVIGARGTVGRALAQRLKARGLEVHGAVHGRGPCDAHTLQLDLASDPAGWPRLPRADVAVLAAGVTSIAACAEDPGASARVNVAGTVALAERLAERGTFVVFLSSNQVFDGSRPRRSRDDEKSPITAYGRQKAAAEQAIGLLTGSACVVRLTKVVHPEWPLLERWRDDLGRGKEISPLHGLTMAPVALDTAIDFLEMLLSMRPAGTFQLSGDDDLPYVALGAALIRATAADPRLLKPLAARSPPPGFEKFPRYTSLDMSLEEALWGFATPSSQAAIDKIARLSTR